MTTRRRSIGLPVFTAAALAAGCGGGTGPNPPAPPPPPPPPSVASVIIDPRGLTLPVGGQGSLAATAHDAAGNPVTSASIGWTSRNAAVATVSATGVVSGLAAGVTQVVASAQGKLDSVAVTVIDNFILEITPPAASTDVGKTAGFTAQARNAQGQPMITPPVTWITSAPAIATIGASGIATGVSPGATTITAAAGPVRSNPAILLVRDTSAAAQACDGIGNVMTIEGEIEYGYKAVGETTEGGFKVDSDDQGQLKATMTRLSVSPFQVAWSGEIVGTAQTTEKRYDDNDAETRSGGGSMVRILNELPKMTLIVDLQTCRYRLRAGATISVRETLRGTTTQRDEIVAYVTFSGLTSAFKAFGGVLEPNDVVAARSVIGAEMNPTEDAVVPLGFAALLFNPVDRQVGQATAGYLLTLK
ncbi:MAG: Ig-like domain-containing protein [Gemmatimonadetes bacterium]|nr:Ig-like domain-containing protein [Gemmatimonadota bacterium]